MNRIISLIAMLALASVASAATPGSVTQGNVTVSWIAAAAPNGMDQYIVALTGSGLVQGYDGAFTGAAINNIKAGTHDTVYQDFADFLASPGDDSHYLIYSSDVVPMPGTAIESATSLAAAFGIPGDSQSPTLVLAQIVVPQGQSFLASGSVAINDARGDFSVPIPEPATMGLLAFGGLELLRRRKR